MSEKIDIRRLADKLGHLAMMGNELMSDDRTTLRQAEKLLRELEQSQWIRVEDPLPEGDVLATNGYDMLVGYIYNDGESETGYACEDEGRYLLHVTHYMIPVLPGRK